MALPQLEVAILWHMHQPDYRDRQTGRAVLPWVRLHAVKDYYPMAALAEEFPELRLTFNYVPSLLAQLEDYLAGRSPDEHLVLSEVPAADLDAEGQTFLLRGFFMANRETMIEPHPRFAELFEKRGPAADPLALEDARRRFSVRDLRDLQVWFNLSWFGPYFLGTDPLLRELQRKGAGFSEEEKAAVLALQREVAGKVVPLLRRLAGEGRVELTTTPFYHPILPLLVDTDVARVALPDAELPRTAFRHPEDARHQIRAAILAHERTFGARPAGMWPSEGSVSAPVLAMLREEGIAWTATDENILFRSLGLAPGPGSPRGATRQEQLCRPYRFGGGDGPAVFFRDHLLSDLVGFTYSRWRPADAVEDFTRRLLAIAEGPAGSPGGRVVSVILDGENAWEYYPDGGLGFLRGLYRRLSASRRLAPTTFAAALERRPDVARLPEIFPGSWINANFAIWIGHREDNRAWDLLTAAREALVQAEASGTVAPEAVREAWEELYMAEGSDWCWWYGDDHTSGNDEVFDELYRAHLRSVYRLIGREEVPEGLGRSILERPGPGAPGLPDAEVSSLIRPTVDGRVSSYFEWLGAAAYEVHRRGQTMHRSDVPVSMVHYGIGREAFYLRLDFHDRLLDPALIGDGILVETRRPRRTRVLVPLEGGAARAELEDLENGARAALPAGSVALGDIFEAAIPWELIGATEGERVEFCVSLLKEGNKLASWPMVGSFAVSVPGADFDRQMWSV